MKYLFMIAALFLFIGSARADQIITLPEDGSRYYTSVFLNGESAIPGWFQTDSRLATLKRQTHFNVMQTSDPQFVERYGKAVTEFPCIALTKADGTVVFKASGKNVPNRPADLVAMIRAVTTVKAQVAAEVSGCNGDCNGQCGKDSCRCRPRPSPVTPAPVTPVVPDVIPDLLGQEAKPEEKEVPFWLGVLLAVGGVGAAIGPKVMKKYKSLELKPAA